ncbi:MAG: ABC transporter substrate-binding protein [Phycisphaerales bacterium JB039]
MTRGAMLFAILLLLGTVGLLLAPGNKRIVADEITFTVWGAPFEDRLFKDIYAEGYDAMTPEVSVDYQRHADVNMKYNAWHARGLGAEVMRLRITDYHMMVQRGMLEPLTPYINDPERGLSAAELAAFPQGIMETLTVDGKLYALPEDSAQFGLYYNRAIFDAYNAAHPDDPIDYPSERWTWDDLRTAARKLTQRGDGVEQEVSGIDLFLWEWPFMHFFLQAGGELWDEDETTTRINSDAGVAALEFLAGLVNDGSWQPFFGRMGMVGPDVRFVTGHTAMLLSGSWWVANFQLHNPDLDFAVAPPPRGVSDRCIAGSVLWGMSSQAPNKDAGWDMIRWLVQEPQALAYWDTLRVAPPAHTGVIASDAFRSTSGVPAPGRPGEYLVPPMRPEDFDDQAAWLLVQLLPDPATGEARATIPATLYQTYLERQIGEMFRDQIREADQFTPERARQRLEAVARAVHDHIDRDRAARGLPPVVRP